MDTQTRHALKKDKFAQATASSVSWVSGHRSGVLRWAIVAVVVLAARDRRAHLLEHALRPRPIAPWAQHWTPTTRRWPRPALRRKTASTIPPPTAPTRPTNSLWPWRSSTAGCPQGAKAHYFAGITDQELGQTASAETELKTAAGSWDHNLANLAKLALAGLYHQTARDPQAIDLYNAADRQAVGDGFGQRGAA